MFTLQTVAAQGEGEGRSGAAQVGGFPLHAGVSIKPGQRAKLERLCRYVSRSPLAQDRLTLSATGQVCYGFKTPWRDGTTHVVLDPLDFIARRSMSGATITTSPRSFGQSSSPRLEVMRVEAFSCRLMSTSANSSSSLKPSR